MSTTQGEAPGVLLCLIAAAGYAIGVVAQKSALLHASALQVTTFGCGVGAAMCLPFAGRLVGDVGNAPLGATLALLYLGLLPTATAFYTWAYALSRSTVGKMGATTYVIPLLVVLLSWLLLDEVPSAVAMAGGAVCLVGVAVSRPASGGRHRAGGRRRPATGPRRKPKADAPAPMAASSRRQPKSGADPSSVKLLADRT